MNQKGDATIGQADGKHESTPYVFSYLDLSNLATIQTTA